MKWITHIFRVSIIFLLMLTLPWIAMAQSPGTPVNCQQDQFSFGQKLVVVSTSQLLFQATSGGWQGLPLPPHWDQVKVAGDEKIYLYDDTMNKLYRLDNNNQNWTTVTTTPFVEQDREEFFPSPNANSVFLSVRSPDEQRRGIYKSSDGGLSWRKTFTNTDFLSTLSPFVFSPTFTQDGTAFAALLGRGTFVGVWRSTDFGENWVKSTNGMTVTVQYGPSAWFAISPQFAQDRTLFSSGGAMDFGYYKSTNAGENWQYIADLRPSDLALSPDYQNDQTLLIASPGDGVYISTNGGASVQQIWNENRAVLVGIRHTPLANTISGALVATESQPPLISTHQVTQTLEMWAVVASSQINTCYLYRSIDRGVTWEQQTLFETPYSTYFPVVAQESIQR